MKTIGCNVKKSVAVIILGLFMVIVCVFFVFVDFRVHEAFQDSIFQNDFVYYLCKGLMGFAFVFLGFGLIVIIRNATVYRNNVIELHDDHIVDRSSYSTFGKVYYADIQKVYIKGMLGSDFLCIEVKDGDKLLKNLNFIKRMFMKGNKKMKYEYFTINDNFLDTDILTLKQLLLDKINQPPQEP